MTKKIYSLINDESLFYTKALTLLFIITGTIGFIGGELMPEEASAVIAQTAVDFNFLKDFTAIQLFLFIFLNNAIKAFIMMLGGIFFGIIPVLFILLNGYAIGIVVSVVLAGSSISTIILGLLPHGFLEIPAVLLAAGYGVWLGEKLYRKFSKKIPLMPAVKEARKVFLYIILPAIAIAALIESTVTIALLKTTL